MVTAYPAVLLRSAVSFSSRSVGCRSFWGFLKGICLCSESTCIVNEIMRRGTAQSTLSLPILFFFWHPQQLSPRDRTADIPSRSPQQQRIISTRSQQVSTYDVGSIHATYGAKSACFNIVQKVGR